MGKCARQWLFWGLDRSRQRVSSRGFRSRQRATNQDFHNHRRAGFTCFRWPQGAKTCSACLSRTGVHNDACRHSHIIALNLHASLTHASLTACIVCLTRSLPHNYGQYLAPAHSYCLYLTSNACTSLLLPVPAPTAPGCTGSMVKVGVKLGAKGWMHKMQLDINKSGLIQVCGQW